MVEIEGKVVELHKPYSLEQYRKERQQLQVTYGKTRKTAGNRWEQELALLFKRSNWTQERLAEQEKKTQPWVAHRLRFGAFLQYITTVIFEEKPPFELDQLAEWRFRKAWKASDPTETNDRIRYDRCIKFLEADFLAEQIDCELKHKGKGTVAETIRTHFLDGKWHKQEAIAAKAQVPMAHAETVLEPIRNQKNKSISGERKAVGKSWKYRFFPIVARVRPISPSEIDTKLSPLVKAFKEEGNRSSAQASLPGIRRLAHDLEVLLNEWTGKSG